MSAGGTNLLDILHYAIAGTALIIVLGGGAFQSWRRWSDNRRITSFRYRFMMAWSAIASESGVAWYRTSFWFCAIRCA